MVKRFIFSVAIPTFVLCDKPQILEMFNSLSSSCCDCRQSPEGGFPFSPAHAYVGGFISPISKNFAAFSCSVWTQEGSDLLSMTRSPSGVIVVTERSSRESSWQMIGPANLSCVFANSHLTRFCYWCCRSVILGHPSSWRTQHTCPWWAPFRGWLRRSSRACPCLKPVTPSPSVWWVRSQTLWTQFHSHRRTPWVILRCNSLKEDQATPTILHNRIRMFEFMCAHSV